MAAASVLAGVRRLWERVVVDIEDQEWDYERPENYRWLVWRLFLF